MTQMHAHSLKHAHMQEQLCVRMSQHLRNKTHYAYIHACTHTHWRMHASRNNLLAFFTTLAAQWWAWYIMWMRRNVNCKRFGRDLVQMYVWKLGATISYSRGIWNSRTKIRAILSLQGAKKTSREWSWKEAWCRWRWRLLRWKQTKQCLCREQHLKRGW
jgi:hypothetical protein